MTHSRVDSGQLEQVVDERAQPAGLIAQRPDVLGGLGDAVVDRLEHRRDRSDRRAEVVARGSHQLPLGVEERLEARGHVVERAAEVGELARTGRGRAHAEVARRDERRRIAEAIDAGRRSSCPGRGWRRRRRTQPRRRRRGS